MIDKPPIVMFIEILIIEILMLFMDEVMFVIIYERLEMIMILIVETIVLKILLFFIEMVMFIMMNERVGLIVE